MLMTCQYHVLLILTSGLFHLFCPLEHPLLSRTCLRMSQVSPIESPPGPWTCPRSPVVMLLSSQLHRLSLMPPALPGCSLQKAFVFAVSRHAAASQTCSLLLLYLILWTSSYRIGKTYFLCDTLAEVEFFCNVFSLNPPELKDGVFPFQRQPDA